MLVPPRDADAGWRLWWGLSSVFRAWHPLVGLWGTGGLQHGDIHAVGLFKPPCARWLMLGAVVSLVASLATAAVVGVCAGGLGRRVCCLPGLVAVLGLYGGPFLLLSCKIYI